MSDLPAASERPAGDRLSDEEVQRLTLAYRDDTRALAREVKERREADEPQRVALAQARLQRDHARHVAAAPAPVGAASAPPAEPELSEDELQVMRLAAVGGVLRRAGLRPAAPVVAAAPEEGERCEECGARAEHLSSRSSFPGPAVAVSEHDTDRGVLCEASMVLAGDTYRCGERGPHDQHVAMIGWGPSWTGPRPVIAYPLVPEDHVVVPVGVTQLADGTRWQASASPREHDCGEVGCTTDHGFVLPVRPLAVGPADEEPGYDPEGDAT